MNLLRLDSFDFITRYLGVHKQSLNTLIEIINTQRNEEKAYASIFIGLGAQRAL